MMAKCDNCKQTFDSQDGGSGCEHCGATFCPTCENVAGVNGCPRCPTPRCVPQILKRIFTGDTWRKYLRGDENVINHVERMLARPAGVLREAEEVLLQNIHSFRYDSKTKTTTEDRDEPMPAPEAPVKIVVAGAVTYKEVRDTIAFILKEQAPGFGITRASARRSAATVELWGCWPVNSNSGTRASIKSYLSGLINGVITTYDRQRQMVADSA